MSEDTQGYPYTQRHYTMEDGTEIVIREWEGKYGRPDGYGHNLRTERTETDPYGGERVFYEDIYGNEVRWIVTGSDGAVRDVYKDADGRWWQELGNLDGTYTLQTIDGVGPGEVPRDTSEYLGEWRDPEEGEEPKGLITQGQSPGEDPYGDIQERPPDDFKDNAVEPPPPYQQRPPDDFKDKAFADDPADESMTWKDYRLWDTDEFGNQHFRYYDQYDNWHEEWTDARTGEHHDVVRVQDPTTGEWRDALPGEMNGPPRAIEYRDKDGVWHDTHEVDGTWHDSWTDPDGTKHYGYTDKDGKWHAMHQGPDGVWVADDPADESMTWTDYGLWKTDEFGNQHFSYLDQHGNRHEEWTDARTGEHHDVVIVNDPNAPDGWREAKPGETQGFMPDPEIPPGDEPAQAPGDPVGDQEAQPPVLDPNATPVPMPSPDVGVGEGAQPPVLDPNATPVPMPSPGVGDGEEGPPPYGQFPMIKDPATGEWVPAIYDMETGEYHPLEGRADEGGEDQPPPVTQTPEAEPPVQPTTPGDADDGGVPGMGVPYEDFIPFIPMVKDPTTGEWRNAYESEGGYTPDPEEVGGGDIIPEYRTLPWLEGDGEEGEQTPPGGDGDGVRLPGMEGPFVDVMPVMVQDPTTGEWLMKVTDPATGELRSPEPGEESPNPNLSELFDPTAPGPTLAPDLFNPNSPGPTLAPRLLLDPDSPGPTLDPALLDPSAPGPTIEPALLDPSAPGPTIEPALLDPNEPGPTLDPALLDPNEPGPTLDPALLDPLAPGETIDPALLDPSAPGPTLDPVQIEQGIVEPSSGAEQPAEVTTPQSFTDPSLPELGHPEPPTTPGQDLDDPSALG